MKNQPLKTEVKDGLLTISIGINTLAWASRAENYGPLEGCGVIEGFEMAWALDVAREIARDDMLDGSPINRLLDEMMINVYEHGSCALDYDLNHK